MDTRKQDTRRKIELGGLVVKAGMASEESAVILGALALARQALQGTSNDFTRARFKAAGDALFREGNDAT